MNNKEIKGQRLLKIVSRVYLSHHMFPIDKSFKSTNCCRVREWEDVLCLNGHGAPVGIFLENDDLKGERRETYTAIYLEMTQ